MADNNLLYTDIPESDKTLIASTPSAWQAIIFTLQLLFVNSVTSKKSPNVYKSGPKIISLEK